MMFGHLNGLVEWDCTDTHTHTTHTYSTSNKNIIINEFTQFWGLQNLNVQNRVCVEWNLFYSLHLIEC